MHAAHRAIPSGTGCRPPCRPACSLHPGPPLRRPRTFVAASERGDGGGGVSGGGGNGGSGGGGGSGGSSGDQPHRWHRWRGRLLWLAAWAAGSELWSVCQYRSTAFRDAGRRAELFSAASSKQQQPPAAAAPQGTTHAPVVSIIVPALNEEAGLEACLRFLQQQLHPPAAEIIVVDGGSQDATVAVARRCGVRVVQAGRGRARQMNAGAALASGDMLVFAHADTRPPPTLLSEVSAALSRPAVVLGGFRPVIEHDGKPLRFFSANNTLKSYYGPLLARPLSFLRGLRCLFGDQTMFCRAADFRRVGGFDSRLPIMEDADLCIRLHMAGPELRPGRRGQVVQINSAPTHTSGRRLANWGRVHATGVHVIIGLSWYMGASPEQLVGIYHRLYTDLYR